MKKSEKIESEIQIRQGQPSLWEIYKESCINKALLKHIIDNDLRHIWRVIFIILSYLVAGTIGFLLKSLGVF